MTAASYSGRPNILRRVFSLSLAHYGSGLTKRLHDQCVCVCEKTVGFRLDFSQMMALFLGLKQQQQQQQQNGAYLLSKELNLPLPWQRPGKKVEKQVESR